jgi:hypothetical protein
VSLRGTSNSPSALRFGGQGIVSMLRADGALELYLSASDFTVHNAALYFVDWLNLGSTENVSFWMPNEESPALSTTVNAGSGVYLPFAFRGGLKIVIQNPAGAAYVNGVFVDPVAPITVALQNVPSGSVLRQPVATNLTAFVSAPGREIASVEFWDEDKKLAEVTEPPYDLPLGGLLAGEYELRAIAYGTYGLYGQSALLRLSIAEAPSAAEFLGSDTNTLGAWSLRYGADGYVIAGDSTNLPSFLDLDWQNAFLYISGDAPIGFSPLERASGGGRIVAYEFNSSEFSVVVDVLDGKPCTVGFYFLDWEDVDRELNVAVESADGFQLDSRQVEQFSAGEYLLWKVQGRTKFRFSTASVNAVVSGFFADREFGPYDLWKYNHFSDSQLAAWGNVPELADADGDGFANGVEYLLGYNPNASTDKPSVRYALLNGALTISFSFRDEAPDADFYFEASDDLLHWTSVFPEKGNSFSGEKEVSYKMPMTPGSRRFFRYTPVLLNSN